MTETLITQYDHTDEAAVIAILNAKYVKYGFYIQRANDGPNPIAVRFPGGAGDYLPSTQHAEHYIRCHRQSTPMMS